MIATQLSQRQVFLFALIAASSLVFLTSCETPILGVGTLVPSEPVQAGVPVPPGAMIHGEDM
jgi:hypothetical protein